MLRIRREVIPEMLEVNPLAAGDQLQRDIAMKMEVPEITQEPDCFPITDSRQKRIHQHDALGFLRKLRRVGVGHHQTDVVTDDRGVVVSERLNERMNILPECLLIVTALRFLRATSAAQIRSDDGMIFRQLADERPPHVARFRVTMKKNYGAASSRDEVMQPDAVDLRVSFGDSQVPLAVRRRRSGTS